MSIENVMASKRLRAVEFFSGVGGLHCGLLGADPTASVVAAYDVNPNANAVYGANFPETPINRSDLKRATAKQLGKFGADAWLMSPPCQPFSRNGKGGDVRDPRSAGFVNLIRVLGHMAAPPHWLFIENVEGFETSECFALLTRTLAQRGYAVEIYVLSPHSFGIPNLRDRAFVLAQRDPAMDAGALPAAPAPSPSPALAAAARPPSAPAPAAPLIRRTLASDTRCREVTYVNGTCEMGTAESEALWTRLNAHCRPLSDFLDPAVVAATAAAEGEVPPHLAVPPKVLGSAGQAAAIDIVAPESVHTACFTKGYRKFTVGTGSVLQTAQPLHPTPIPRDEATLGGLGLRYFSPREIANLHGFPSSFVLDGVVSVKQQYKLLGNSLSVTVVAALLRHLLSGAVGSGESEEAATVVGATVVGAMGVAAPAAAYAAAQPLSKKPRT